MKYLKLLLSMDETSQPGLLVFDEFAVSGLTVSKSELWEQLRLSKFIEIT